MSRAVSQQRQERQSAVAAKNFTFGAGASATVTGSGTASNQNTNQTPKHGTTFKFKDAKGTEHTYSYNSSYGWVENNRPISNADNAKVTQAWQQAGGVNNPPPKTYGDKGQFIWDAEEKKYKNKDTGEFATIDEAKAADAKYHDDNVKQVQGVAKSVNKGINAVGNFVSDFTHAIDSFKKHDNGVRTFIDPTAKYDRANAELMREQSADLQSSAQRNLQIANRDERAEADKDAAAIAAGNYQQTMSQISGAAGGGAAAIASMNTQTADPNVHRARADAAHAKGTEQRQEANVLQQQSMDARAIADDKDYRAMLNSKQAAEAQKLSEGPMGRWGSGMEDIEDDTGEGDDTTFSGKKEDSKPKVDDNKIPGQQFNVYELQEAFTKLGGKKFTSSNDPSKLTPEGVEAAKKYLISKYGSDPGTYDYTSRKSGLGTNAAHQYMQKMRGLYWEGLDKNKNVKTTVKATTMKKGMDGTLTDKNGDGVIDKKDIDGSDKNIKHIISAINRRFI